MTKPSPQPNRSRRPVRDSTPAGTNPLRAFGRQEKLVELRYFGGLSVHETAEILGVSVPTVVRDWKAVRTWLHGELQPLS